MSDEPAPAILLESAPGWMPGLVVRQRDVVFKNEREKAAWLDMKAHEDAKLPTVRDFAVRFARAVASPDNPLPIVSQLHAFVRDSIRYVPDPSEEEFADSAVILARGADDCDGKARLFVALCTAVGIEARIVPVWSAARHFVHVQAESRWTSCATQVRLQPDGWVLSELIAAGCPLGASPFEMPRDEAGRIPLR